MTSAPHAGGALIGPTDDQRKSDTSVHLAADRSAYRRAWRQFTCSRPRRSDGRACRNPVAELGAECWVHRDDPACDTPPNRDVALSRHPTDPTLICLQVVDYDRWQEPTRAVCYSAEGLRMLAGVLLEQAEVVGSDG